MNRRLLMAGGGSGAFPELVPVIAGLTSSPDGGWPSVSGQAERYDGSVYFGWVDSSGNVKAGAYVEATGSVSTFTLHATLEVDWHDAPAVCVRPDGHIITAYSKHAEIGGAMYVRVSSNAGDISAWGAEANIDSQLGGDRYTYPMLFAHGSTLYLFYRHELTDVGPTAVWSFSTSTDGGATWAAETQLFKILNTVTYWHVNHDGAGRFDFVVSDGGSPTVALYHFYMVAGTRYMTDGTTIGASPPLGVASLTSVASGTNASPLAVNANGGLPVIPYPTYGGGSLDWHYAYWTGAAWTTNAIVTHTIGSEAWVYGGVAVESAGVLWLSVKAAGHYSLYRYRTWDNGATWHSQLVGTSPSDDFYPVPVRNPGRLRAVALRGTASSYTSYTLQVVGAALY